MPCYRPLQGYRARRVSGNGKRAVVFNTQDGFPDRPVLLPCNACIGCHIDYSEDWAVRCMHESQFYAMNCFVTLTYNDRHLPENKSLVKRDFQLFMKKLRRNFPQRISYFMCGEYGGSDKRPHYHAILFGVDFDDKRFHSSKNGNTVWKSDKLEYMWGKGFCTIGTVSFASAAYVARYCLKKLAVKRNLESYETIISADGEMNVRVPEFVQMSLRPAIGRRWIEKYHGDVYPDDFVVAEGREKGVPRYYDKWLEKCDPEEMKRLKLLREKQCNTRKFKLDNTVQRLEVKEEVKEAQIGTLNREIEK